MIRRPLPLGVSFLRGTPRQMLVILWFPFTTCQKAATAERGAHPTGEQVLTRQAFRLHQVLHLPEAETKRFATGLSWLVLEGCPKIGGGLKRSQQETTQNRNWMSVSCWIACSNPAGHGCLRFSDANVALAIWRRYRHA